MPFEVPGNETHTQDSALRRRALRFAGVRLGAAAHVAKPRPELVRAAAGEGSFESRLKRFVFRSGTSL